MSSLRLVDRSAVARENDRASLCRFTLADGHRCALPAPITIVPSPPPCLRELGALCVKIPMSPVTPHALTHSESTLTESPASTDFKQLTLTLNSLDATPTKKRAVWLLPVGQTSVCLPSSLSKMATINRP
jgi:hypothetical protein